MEFLILGPFEVKQGGRPLPLGGGKKRALLARLLLDANRVVSVEGLIDDLWGEDPPATANKALQGYVSQLRKFLPDGTLSTRAPGYLVELPSDSLDLSRFEAMLAKGRTARVQGRREDTRAALEDALALWRGPALAEFSEPFARTEAARLAELRLTALEERIDAVLALGRHAEVVSELAALVDRHPLRERLRAQQMLGLYRLGRQPEALAAYQSFRTTLHEELGIEPSTGLRSLEGHILRQEPDLDWRPEDTPPSALGARPTGEVSDDGGPDLQSLETRYARSGEVSIAYQVIGEGPPDLVLVHGWICSFHPGWEYTKIANFYRRLASLGRLILFDKRGTGLSDRVSPERLPDLETRMDDVRAVMDAVGSEQAVLLGISEGGPMCSLFAATYPERTIALCLMGTFARWLVADDYPIGFTEEDWRARHVVPESEDWATVITLGWLERMAPAIVHDDDAFRWYRSYVTRGASPGATLALGMMNKEIDIRDVLPACRVPTLSLYRADEHYREASRYMAERIEGAKIAELPGEAHLPWEGDQASLFREIESFLSSLEEEDDRDRVLVTVLVAEPAANEQRPARQEFLERYDGVFSSCVSRFRGRAVAGEAGRPIAVFDGPARAIRCASAIVSESSRMGLAVRAGLHTGEVQLTDGQVHGVAVDIGVEIQRCAGPGEVLVSRTVRDLVAGSRIEFAERGRHEFPDIPGDCEILSVRQSGDAREGPLTFSSGARDGRDDP